MSQQRMPIPSWAEYSLYILLLLGCIFFLYRTYLFRPQVEPSIILHTDPTELPDINLME